MGCPALSVSCQVCGGAGAAGARFCAGCGALLPAVTQVAGMGERRQIAFLMADLVGSTVLLERLDPEDLIDLTADYHRGVTDIVERFSGRIARLEGDGATAFFGYPVALEDCPAQAVRAGRAIVAEIERLAGRHRLPAGVPLAVRIGIECGPVVISNQPSASGRVEDTFFAGNAPNIAARLQTIAPPQGVAVGPMTRRLAGAAFTWSDLGARELKGFSAPIAVYLVTGEDDAGSRLEGRLRRTRSPMVNRHDEMECLRAAWDDARAGQRRCVVIVGEPGIGKSRVLHSFLDRLGGQDPPIRLALQCLQTLINTPLFPHIDLLRRMARIADADPPASQLDKLRDLLREHAIESDETLLLLAELLSIPPTGLPPVMMSGLLRRQRTFAGVIALIRALSRKAPVVMVYEDVHWLDQTSMDLLDQIIAGTEGARVLVLATTRPDKRLPINDGGGATELALGRLSAAHAREIVDALATDAGLPAGTLERIVARTDGVPLFVEELTQMVLDDPAAPAARMPALPETLLGLLQMRLDQLGPARVVAQIGAIIGRTFGIGMVARVLEVAAESLAGHVDTLTASGLAQATGLPGELTFKHALVQDAAAESILARRRRQLHGQIARLLIDDQEAAEPEAVARHLAGAGEHLDAAQWWLRAARQSIGRGAMPEASTHFRAGLDVLSHLPADATRARAEVALLGGLGPTLMVMHGPGAPAFGDVQRQAFEVMSALPDKPGQFPITYGLALYHWGRAELADAARHAAALRAAAAARPSDEWVMAANNMSAMVAFHQGRPAEARDLLRVSTGLYDPAAHAQLYPLYMMDFGVFGRFYLALAESMTGDPDRALACAAEAADLARRLGQPHSVGFSMLANFIVHAFRGEHARAMAWTEKCQVFSREQGFPEFVGLAMVVGGWAEAECGDPEAGLAMLETGVALWRRTGFENWQTWFAVLQTDVLLKLDRAPTAVVAIEEQLARIAVNGEVVFEPLLIAAKARAMERARID